MRDTILLVIGIAVMAFLGYRTAVGGAQDLVWLLIPGLGLAIAIFAASRIFKGKE